MPSGPLTEVRPPRGQALFLDGFFPIGVFSQPVESFAKWKARGVNTLLEVPQNHDAAAWDRAAREAGLKVMRRPGADPKADIGRKDLLAWTQWDEPDAAGRIFEWTPLFQRTYAEWKRLDPSRPVFVNFAGPDVTWFTSRNDDYSRRYSAHYPRLIAAADWVTSDLYPNGGYLNEARKARRGDVTLVGEPVRVLGRMTTKPQFAFVEASEIEQGNVAGARAPTPGSVRAQIWYLVTLGVRGVFYFPAVVGTRGFQFDGAPEPIVKEIVVQNKLLAQLGPVLQGPINPSGLGVKAPASLAVGWRLGDGVGVFIVVNATPETIGSATLELRGVKGSSQAAELSTGSRLSLDGSRLKAGFGPYEVKVLVVPLG